jgi:P4 family phage/plasmid primase-like protien
MIDANEEWPIAEPPSSDLHQDPVQHQDVGVGWGSGIFDQHREMLQASKITADHARARGYRSVDTKVRLGQIGIAKAGRRIPGLLMPLLGVDGKPWGWQYRPDNPRRNGQDHVIKYETPVGQHNKIDVPPGVAEQLTDPSVPLWITEGVKKADAGALAGLCIVDILGVWGWRGTNGAGGKVALPDFHDIALNGRRVILAFDSDVMTKPQVRAALNEFSGWLKIKGAKVEYCCLPDASAGKTGLDDYLADRHTADDLWHLVRWVPTEVPMPATNTIMGTSVTTTGITSTSDATQAGETRLEDAYLAEIIANRALRGRYVWVSGLGWMRYHGGVWKRVPDDHVAERVRLDLIKQHEREAKQGASVSRLKELSAILAAGRIRGLAGLCRGILLIDAAEFDAHPDLLNAANGVVDLRTGQLLPHDPELYLTKITKVPYMPGATSPDWDTALEALPPDVTDWMQIRIGQAATGYPTPDDILPVSQGGGANGKTTFFGAIQRALGDHAVVVPERVLMANPSDHPTELMTLRGARLALIEETPETRHLSVKRLKDTVGQPVMTARYIRQDNVTWECTHSLFVTTNYRPRVDEVDHGTWRRLALVRFPYTFTESVDTSTNLMARPSMPGLRERLRTGGQDQHEAVLEWIVQGACRWYARDRLLPPPPRGVQDDTAGWRAEADVIFCYIKDRIIFEPGLHVLATELYEDFGEWLRERGHKPWTDSTFFSRFGEHVLAQAGHAHKQRIRFGQGGLCRRLGHFHPPPAQYTAWVGVRFRRDDDDAGNERGDDVGDDAVAGGQFESWPSGSDKAEYEAVQAVQGQSGVPREEPPIRETGRPLHRLHGSPGIGSAGGPDLFDNGLWQDGDLDEWLGQQEGRCPDCRWHIATQGHHADCSRIRITS